MKINRYSQVTPSRYSPMSLDEIMMVPLLKRKQHDELTNSIATTRAGMSAVDSLDVHSPIVAQKQAEIDATLEQQAEEAATNGISNSLRGDFMDINAKYQEEMGPRGTFGKADAIKKKYEQERKDILSNAVQLGHNPSETEKRMDEAYQRYVESHDGKTISDVPLPKPPNYRRLQDALQEIKPLLGSTIETNRGFESYEIIPDPDTGALVFRTESGQVMTESNDEQLNEAKRLLQDEFMTPGAEGFESAAYNGISPEHLANQITAGVRMMKTNHTKDTRQAQHQIASDMNSKGNDGSSLTNPEKWQARPLIARTGKDGGNPLASSLLNNPNYRFVSDSYGLAGRTFKDTRIGEEGANYRNDGKFEVTGTELENMFLDPNYQVRGPRGSGIYDPETGDNLVIAETVAGGQLIIEGMYNGEKYSLTIQDDQIAKMFRKYGTTEEGKQQFSDLVTSKRKTMNDLREADPYLSNMSDKEIAVMYTEAVQQASVYQQMAVSPLNKDNTFYRGVNEDVLGVPGTFNLGSINSSKVRIFQEDGSDIMNFNGAEGVNKLSNLLVNEDFDDLDEKERSLFFKKLHGAHNHGITVGDHEFANEINYSVTGHDGSTIYFKVENNESLSGKDGTLLGIDDASEMQKYLIEGKPFVNAGVEVFHDNTGNQIKAQKYFAHIPYLGHNGFRLKPVVVYGTDLDFTSLGDLSKAIDPETLEPIGEYANLMTVESLQDASSRVGANLMKYYNTAPQGKTTKKDAVTYVD